jgi:hypothetical protein
MMHRAFCLSACNQFAQRQIPKESFLHKVESNSNLITEHIVCSMICYLMQIHELMQHIVYTKTFLEIKLLRIYELHLCIHASVPIKIEQGRISWFEG